MTRFYFTRHGESEDDLTDSYGGASDFPLTDRGKEQALAAGAALRGCGVEEILTSPLRRAAQSAEIMSQSLGGVPVTEIFDLRERNTYGVWSGLTRSEARRIFGYLMDRLEGNPGKDTTCAPGGEEYGAFVSRVERAWREVIGLCQERQRARVAIVTHGKFTLGLFTEVLQVGDDYDKGLGSIKVVDFDVPRLSAHIPTDAKGD